MIQQKVDRLKSMMESVNQDHLQYAKVNSIDLISSRLSRKPDKTPSIKNNSKFIQTSSKQSSPSKAQTHLKHQMILSQVVFRKLYQQRCLDLKIDENQSSWSGFLKTFTAKNQDKKSLDFAGFNFREKSLIFINQNILGSQWETLNLSRNYIDVGLLKNLGQCLKLRSLYLRNCGLHNEQLEELFIILEGLPLEVLSLSSPDLKDRNNLTKYLGLCHFIERSKDLKVLELSNIQIHPDCPIFQSCKKSSIKSLDLSKNTGVIGICKNLERLDISWNDLENPQKLIAKDSSLKHLNLTGNPIPEYTFQQFLTPIGYPNIVSLTLNQIVFNRQIPILQVFIEKSHNLKKLEFVTCQLNKHSLKFILYGVENNKNLEVFNISKNKFPTDSETAIIAQGAFTKSHLKEIHLHECEINDNIGSIIFQGLRCCVFIKYIDLSKNYLSSQTSNRFCAQLKNGCYSLITIQLQQNLIKYDQLKQIMGYLNRNIYFSRKKLKEQYQKLKNISTSEGQLSDQTHKAHKQILQLNSANNQIQKQYYNRLEAFQKNDIGRIEKELLVLDQQESLLNSQTQKLQAEIQELQEKLINSAEEKQA